MLDITLLATGVGAIVFGLAATALIVWKDLGPAAQLNFSQRLLLAAALGLGVLAFAIKVAVMENMTIGAHAPPAVATLLEPPSPEFFVGNAVWEGLPEVAPSPADNPTTPEKVALGEKLFRDPALSGDGTIACLTCHDIDHGAGAEPRRNSRGIKGQIGARNSPTVFNAAFQSRLFWDGRARTLEEQALGPIANPIEMGNRDIEGLARKLANDPAYAQMFRSAFGAGAPIDSNAIAKALAAFERRLVTSDSPYDRFLRGDETALTPQQIQGMALFERVGCIQCHSGPNFSGASFLAPASKRQPMRLFPANPDESLDRYNFERGVWRIPTLRNIALTGPYFHNGAVDDLSEAVRIMAVAQLNRTVSDEPFIKPRVAWISRDQKLVMYTPERLNSHDIAAIVAFLRALSSDRLAASNVAASK